MRSLRHRGASAGFTLIELLVTMAIISLLAALLLPALQKTLMKSRQIWCASNLRQIGIAFHGFAHEHGGFFPQQASTNSGGALELSGSPTPLWGQFLRSPAPFASLSNELGNPHILGCPATRRGPARFSGLNSNEVGYLAAAGAVLGSSLRPLAADSNLDVARSPATHRLPGIREAQLAWTRERHDSRGNVLFGDGHVELRKNLTVSITDAISSPTPTGPTDKGGGSHGDGREDGRGKGDGGGASGSGSGSPSPGPAAPKPKDGDPSGGRRIATVQAVSSTASSSTLPPAAIEGSSRTPAPNSASPLVSGGLSAGEPESQARREALIKACLLWLFLVLMLLGLAAMIAHAWQRYKTLSGIR